MKLILTYFCFFVFLSVNAQGFEEKLEVEGAIQIGDSEDRSPDPGTIRWTGSDFEGWNGVIWVSLTRHASVGTVTDIDGNQYKTIRIGYLEWMVENLRVSILNNTTAIDSVGDDSAWINTEEPAWCWYGNDKSMYGEYGKLYNWYAVSTGNLCPSGWKVPSDNDWSNLRDFLNGNPHAGPSMKEVGTAHWMTPNIGANNESGFTGLPGGYRSFTPTFKHINEEGFWWSSTEEEVNVKAWAWQLFHDFKDLDRLALRNEEGLSVRCVKN